MNTIEFLTKAQYARKRRVSEAYVGQEVKRGNLDQREFPIFIEFEGRKFQVSSMNLIVHKKEDEGKWRSKPLKNS